MTFVKKLVGTSYFCPLVVTLREIKILHKAENYFISNKSPHLRNILQLLPSLFFSCIKWVYTELCSVTSNFFFFWSGYSIKKYNPQSGISTRTKILLHALIKNCINLPFIMIPENLLLLAIKYELISIY